MAFCFLDVPPALPPPPQDHAGGSPADGLHPSSRVHPAAPRFGAGRHGTRCVTGGRCLQCGHAATSLHCVSPPWAAWPICGLPPPPSHRPPPAVPPLWSISLPPPSSQLPSTAGCSILPISSGVWIPPTEPLPPSHSPSLSWWDSWDLSRSGACYGGHPGTPSTVPQQPAARLLGIP